MKTKQELFNSRGLEYYNSNTKKIEESFYNLLRECSELNAGKEYTEELIKFLEWRDKQNILVLDELNNEELIAAYERSK